MPYTVWSRGRLIGETDLAFARMIDVQRSGWFHPTAEGERVIAVATAAQSAIRAYRQRDASEVRDAADGFVHPELEGTTLLADLAEAFQHAHALELELRREDGSVVPTEDIGFQDTHHLSALAEADLREADERSGEDGWADDLDEPSEADRQLEIDVLHDLELLEEGWTDDSMSPWTPDEEHDETRFPRYQIHVMLLDRGSIP